MNIYWNINRFRTKKYFAENTPELLKIPRVFHLCGFDSRPGHQDSAQKCYQKSGVDKLSLCN